MSLPMQVQSRLSHFKSHILGLVAAHVLSVAMVSRLFGISRNTFYKYRHQAEQGRLASCDCTPRVHGSATPQCILEAVCMPRHHTPASASNAWPTSSPIKAWSSPPIPCSVSCASIVHLYHRSHARHAIGTPLKLGRLMACGRWLSVISLPANTTALIALCLPSWTIIPAQSSPVGGLSDRRFLRW